MSSFEYSVENWQSLEEKTLLETPVFDIKRRRAILNRENLEGAFYLIQAPAWVNILATTEDGRVILVEQYRHGIEEPTIEIPGGVVDQNENPQKAARRELLEETGYRVQRLHYLGKVSSNPALFTNYTHMYWGEDCRRHQSASTDRHEFIKTHLMPEDTFFERVKNGEIHHALVVAAAARYMLYRREKG